MDLAEEAGAYVLCDETYRLGCACGTRELKDGLAAVDDFFKNCGYAVK